MGVGSDSKVMVFGTKGFDTRKVSLVRTLLKDGYIHWDLKNQQFQQLLENNMEKYVTQQKLCHMVKLPNKCLKLCKKGWLKNIQAR